jgi:hypothetical protein
MSHLAHRRWQTLIVAAVTYAELPLAATAESPPAAACETAKDESAVTPTPFDSNLPSSHYSGMLIGKDMLVYPRADLANLKTFNPAEAANTKRLLISINGIGNDVRQSVAEMEVKAAKERCAAVCLYDDSSRSAADIVQAISHKINVGESRTVATLKSAIIDALRRGDELYLSADSRGSIVVSRALSLVRKELLAKGQTEPSILRTFSALRIATTGGVSYQYPDGPKYVHYVCRHDAFAFYFGLGTFGMTAEEAAEAEKSLPRGSLATTMAKSPAALKLLLVTPKSPGKDATIVYFDSPRPDDSWTSHNIYTYFDHVKPFDEIYGKLPLRAVEHAAD